MNVIALHCALNYNSFISREINNKQVSSKNIKVQKVIYFSQRHAIYYKQNFFMYNNKFCKIGIIIMYHS